MSARRSLIIALMLCGCGKPAPDRAPTPPEPKPEPVAQHACTSDADCMVSCDRKDDCCGPLCGCLEVVPRAEALAIQAYNREHCPAEPACKTADCMPPEHEAVPRCRAGACEAELVPRGPAGPAGPPPGVAPKPPLPARQVDGYWIVDGAPSPSACTVDADCKGDT